MLAHLHVIGCPCSRCATARNYARLLATVTPSSPREAPKYIAPDLGRGHALLDAEYLDSVSRDTMIGAA